MKKLLSVLLAMIMLFSTLSCLTMSASAVYDSISSARSISSGVSYTGTISTADTVDYYKFTLSSSSTVTLSVNAALRELYVTLYDEDGNQIADDGPDWNSGGQIVFNRTYTFTKGTYYIKISKGYYTYDDNYGNYSLKLTTTSSNETFSETKGGLDNSIATANSISPKTTYKGQIAFNDTVDFYKFVLSTSSAVTLDVNGALRELYVTIYDEEGNQIADNSPDWNSSGQIVFNRIYTFTKGTYYIKISKGYYSYDDNYGNYSFKYTTSSANETFAETKGGIDNSIATANKISLGKTYKGQIAFNDLDDYYKFSVSDNKININVNGKVSELYIRIYDANGSEVFYESASANDSGSISYFNQITLTEGTYYLRISKGYYSSDNNYGNYSFTVSKYIPATSITSVSNITKGVSIKWSKIEGVSGYYVYRKTSGGSYSKIKTLKDGSAVSFTDESVKSGKTYYYYVKAYSGSSTSEKSGTAKIKRLARPVLKSASNTENGVLVKWEETTGAYGYKVYRKTSDGWKYIGKTTNAYFTDKTATSGKKYTYTVRAYSGDFISSYNSTGVSKYYLADPTLKTPSSTTSGIKLSWTKSAGAEGYIIYRKTGSGSYTKLKTEKGVSNLSYTDSSAKKGTKYTYKVKAYKSKTYSAYSNTKTITDKY